jgi:TnpA family transposase
LPRGWQWHARNWLAQAGNAAANLLPILSSPIDWDEIEQQYDEMVKYAAAMQSRTADPEAILLRFARAEVMPPAHIPQVNR